eukprot:6483291-Amphidinium_carterae.1
MKVWRYYMDTQERAWLPLPRIKETVYRADFLAVARALEECQPGPRVIVSDCKGVVKALQALQSGRRHAKGRNRDLEHHKRQDCRKIKVRPAGLLAPEVRRTDLGGAPPEPFFPF